MHLDGGSGSRESLVDGRGWGEGVLGWEWTMGGSERDMSLFSHTFSSILAPYVKKWGITVVSQLEDTL